MNKINIVYLFLVYKNPEQLLHTIRRLEGENVEFFVHVDASSNIDFSCLKHVKNLYFSAFQQSIEWGGVNIVVALLDCLREIVRKCHGDYVILMSESDYPVKSNFYIREFLSKHPKDYIVTHELPLISNNPSNLQEGGRRRLECYALRLQKKAIATIEPKKLNIGNMRQFIKVLRYNPFKLFKAINIFLTYPQRRHPSDIKPCYGELWFVLRISTIEAVLSFCDERQDYLDYCKDTQVLDEIFLPTLVNHIVPLSERLSSPLRFINWKGNSSSPSDITLDDYDLINQCITNPAFLFARKIQNMKVCEFIDKRIDR